MKKLLSLPAFLLVFALAGAEYFVSPAGSDKADGRSEKSAFKTISKGMEALKAGDTLTILPGKYHEAVKKVLDGDPAKRTVIRAKFPGTVLLHGDRPLKDFRVYDKEKGIYVARCESAPEAVFEADTFALYEEQDRDFISSPLPEPGRFFYDAKEKLIYLRTSDAAPPSRHVLGCSVFPTDGFAVHPGKSGKVRNVEIDGLLVRGFMTQKVGFFFASWGIVINNAENCLIRRCTAVLNCGGISMTNAFRSRIEGCAGLGNGTRRQVSGGNIIVWSGRESVIDDCLSYRSRTYGIRFYGSNQAAAISRSVSIEDQRGSIWIKPSDPQCRFSHIFSPALVACKNSEYSLFRVNDYDPKGVNGKTSLAFGKETIQAYPESFADVTAFDFRLTKGSKFKQGFAGQNFRYMAWNGSDGNDGLSVKTPRKTLAGLPDGTTVYLLPGKYPGDIAVSQNGLTLAGYGQNAPAVISGQVKVTGNGVKLRKLGFVTPGTAVSCTGKGLMIENCGFARAETAVKTATPVTVTHCAFAPEVKNVVSGAGSVVKMSILGTVPESAVLFGNAYPGTPPAQDPAGCQLTAKFTGAAHGDFTLKNEKDFEGRAADGTLIGPAFYLFEPRNNSYFNMKILPAGAGAVSLQFESDAVVKNSNVLVRGPEGKWRTFRDCTASVTQAFVSLDKLQPGGKYECYIVSDRQNRYRPGNHYLPKKIDYKKPGKNRSPVIYFTAPAADRAPRVWHVAPNGDDRNPGTKEKPLKRIVSAALKTEPGDTVMVHEGVYRETVLVPVSGAPGKPVTYCAAPGETVYLDGAGRQFCRAFGAFGKSHLRFDGFRIRMFGTALVNASGVFIFFGSNDIVVSRNFYDGRSPGYSPSILHTRFSKNITMKNCVDIGSMTGIAIIDTSGVVIENCVMKMSSIWPLFCMGNKEHRVRFAYNIVTDNTRAKTHEPLIKVTSPEILDESNNIFFARLPREQRVIFGLHSGKKWTIDEYYRLTGKDGGSYFADPGFAAMPKLLTWKNWEERAADMKKGVSFGRVVNNYEDARDPQDRLRYRVWDFRDFFATPERRAPDGRIIGLEPEQFKDFSEPTNGGKEWRVFK